MQHDKIAYEVIITFSVLIALSRITNCRRVLGTLMKRKLIKICNYLYKSAEKNILCVYVCVNTAARKFIIPVLDLDRERKEERVCGVWFDEHTNYAFYCDNSMQLNDLHILQN